jgi:hypothetical protein
MTQSWTVWTAWTALTTTVHYCQVYVYARSPPYFLVGYCTETASGLSGVREFAQRTWLANRLSPTRRD